METIKKVHPQELGALPVGVILDVRTVLEHDEKCLDCEHEHVPLQELDPTVFITQKGLKKDTPIYLLCRSGMRATQAAEKFVAQGYTNVYVIEGGLLSCESCGHKIKEGLSENKDTHPL